MNITLEYRRALVTDAIPDQSEGLLRGATQSRIYPDNFWAKPHSSRLGNAQMGDATSCFGNRAKTKLWCRKRERKLRHQQII